MKHLFLLVVCCVAATDGRGQWVEPPQFEWARTVNSPSEMSFEGMEVGADGRVYVCGFFKDQICFEDTICFLTTGQQYDDDIFVACYDSTGLLLWAKTFGENSEDRARDIALDSDGNLLVAGRFSHIVWFDQIPAIPYGPAGLFICKISPDGQVLDVHVISGDFYEVLQQLEVDHDNNIWIAGHFSSDTLHFGDTLIARNLAVQNEMFIAKIDTNWSTAFVITLSPLTSYPRTFSNMEVSDDGSAYLLGSFGDSLVYDKRIYTRGPGSHTFLFKFNHLGELKFGKIFYRIPISIKHMLADQSNNLYLSGGINGQVYYDTISLSGGYFLMKLDSLLVPIWAYSFGQDRYNAQRIWSSNDVVYTIGPFSFEQVIEDTIIYSSGNFPSALSSDILMLRHSSETGELEWFKQVGWTGDEAGGYLKGNDNGNLYVTGGFTSAFTILDSIQLQNPFPGQNSVFIARLKQDSLPPPLSIPEGGWLLYPNPVQEQLTVAGEWQDGIATIALFSTDGRLVFEKTIQADAHLSKVTILLPSHLAAGLYLLRIRQQERTGSYKLLKNP